MRFRSRLLGFLISVQIGPSCYDSNTDVLEIVKTWPNDATERTVDI